MIDLSINEETVHWCGHSEHKLSRPFNDFVSSFLSYNSNFYQHLDNHVLSDVTQKELHSEIYAFVMQVDFKFLE
jgi:ABC-type proline/glycine betaine transport system ATPase subunit